MASDPELEQLEAELAALESGDNNEGDFSPDPPKKDSTLVLFRELIKSKSSTKFGNLTSIDLGKSKMSVRDTLDIALYCDKEGLDDLGQYFRDKAEIVLSTSLSHKGKLIDNIVTQIKKEKKETTGGEPIKKGFFNTKPQVEGQQ